MENVMYYEDPTPLSGSEIADVLGISRMSVSQTLKRGLRKIYHLLKKTNRHLDPFEIAVLMAEILCVAKDSDGEMNKFFNLFPSDIKEEIKTYAEDRIRH